MTDERAFSLVEELVSLAVVSLGLVLLIAMISTGTKGVTTTVDRVTAEGLARSQLEQVKADTYGASYATLSAPSDYSIGLTIAYWNSGTSSFESSDTGSGLQKITVTISRASSQILQVEDYKVNR
jgi:type II secretory pathway pseudopilin PulG